jgi:hypothetical protein
MKLFLSDRALLFLACLLCITGPFNISKALAQTTITTVTPLNFGVIAIRDWASVGRVTINPGGSFTYNSNVYLLQNPERGEYRIDGAPANTIYTVTLPLNAILMGPGGNFILDDFGVEPALLITNAAGEDTFYIIGRLQTQGGGIIYNDGSYNSVFTVTVNF